MTSTSRNPAIYRARRQRVLETMAARGGGVAIQPTAPERLRNRDSEYLFRFDSHFFYLSGFGEPESVIALVAHGGEQRSILFCRDKSEEREIWRVTGMGPKLPAKRSASMPRSRSASSTSRCRA